ncbi:MAG: initiation factor 2B [Desulfurococcus sp.]|jgi:translation initiation factor eIF-2B subunit delta|uniref:translation initiation factor eIF-2B n=1 Tax=Desulfurococcus sp. TaxID=51678 RepID=UPI00315FA91D
MSELERHGFTRRATGSELLFQIASALKESSSDVKSFARTFTRIYEDIINERPSSMASLNALRMIGEYFLENGVNGIRDYIDGIVARYDESLMRAAEVAAKRVVEGDALITNSNSLAIRRFFKTLSDNKVKVKVYVTESRPGLEGLLMAEYLEKLGFEVYLIVDSAARFFMKNIDKAVLGAEAVAVNGAVVSKIGTSVIALDAHEARVRVFVVAPTLKFSIETIYGELIKLPEGDWHLLMDEDTRRTLPENYRALAPLYDVTPAEYVDGIATEKGLFAPQAIPIVIREVYGGFPPLVKPLEKIAMEVRRYLG